MKETKIKALVQKSKLETSNDFTKKILDKLEVKPEVEKKTVWPFGITFGTVTLLIVSLSYLIFRNIDALSLEFNQISGRLKAPILLLISVIFLLSLNYMIRLNEARKRIKTETFNYN